MEQTYNFVHAYGSDGSLSELYTDIPISPSELPTQSQQQSYITEPSPKRPGFIRRVTTWSDTISNRNKRSMPSTYRSRYLSESQPHPRSPSPCSSNIPETRRAASIQERQPSVVRKGELKPRQGSIKTVLKDIYTNGYRSRKYSEYDHSQLSSLREGVSETNLGAHSPHAPRSECGSISETSKAISHECSASRTPSVSQTCDSDSSKLDTTTHDDTSHTPICMVERVNTSEMLPICVGFLDKIFQGQHALEQIQSVSPECVRELVAVADFMFAARSYRDCFEVCRQLWPVVKPADVGDQGSVREGSTSLWLPVAVNMAKSAQSSDDYLTVAHMMESIPRRDEWPEYYKTGDYCRLYAFLGHVFLQLGDIARADDACVESWTHYQTLVTKQPLTQHIISAAQDEIYFAKCAAAEHIGQKVLTQIKRKMSVTPSAPVIQRDLDILSPSLNPSIDQNIQEVLTWCMEKISDQDFSFMVSTIDDGFWSNEVDENDIREFERCVMLCYLSVQLRSSGRSQKNAAQGSNGQSDISGSFEQIQHHSGLSNIQILTAVAKAVSNEDDGQSVERNQDSLPERFLQRIEALWKDMIIHTVGYTRTGQGLTSDTLLNCFEWPGKHGTIVERFCDQTYQERVSHFLRDFTIRKLERDLSEKSLKDSASGGLKGTTFRQTP